MIIHRRHFFSIMLLLVGLAMTLAFPQSRPALIGYTDSDIFVPKLPEYPQAQQSLQQINDQLRIPLDDLAADLQARLSRYEKQKALLSAESRSVREQELTELQKELENKTTAAEQQYQQKQNDLLRPMLDKVQKAIDAVAEEKGLAIVIKAGSLLYVDDQQAVNITTEVALRLGLPVTGQ